MFNLSQETLWQEWAPLPLRLIIGYGFLAHGWAKLSRGPAEFAKLLEYTGTPQPEITAWVSTFIEILGGLAILAGAFVAVVSIPLIVMMLVALFIALPVLRVLVMLGAFIVDQDYRLVLVATVVLITILAGLVIGLSLASSPAH